MRKYTNLLTIALYSLLVFACDHGEIPIEPVDRGDAIITQLEMGASYEKQLYFDLGTNSLIAENDKNNWDIALIQDNGEYRIVMNDSRGGKLAYEQNGAFEDAVNVSLLA